LAGDVFLAGLGFLTGDAFLLFVTLEGGSSAVASSFFGDGLAFRGDERIGAGFAAAFAPFFGVAAFALAIASVRHTIREIARAVEDNVKIP